ncbi:MAG: T9SS type A sorting domain-containing protein, partial [Algibacter sp.]
SSEYITIQGVENKETLFIYDVLGNKILETVEKQINVSTYSPGLYFVKKGSSKKVLKFVKQ